MNGTNPSLTEASARGRLKVNVVSQATSRPVPEAKVSISYTGVPDSLVEQLSTDASGQTSSLELEAPPLEYSLEESSEQQPYAEYTIQVEAPGYEPVSVAGAEILPDVTALQNIALPPRSGSDPAGEVFVIPAHTLYGSYPAKIPESEIKPVTETGEIVLSRVVVPEYIVVHDGSPRDSTARDYYVRYKDYIKNVASSEIYATWPAETIRANVLAIMSFTLNRVYTEWYRNMPNVRQPLLTQYCDGRQVRCPGWMTQWGSKSLGDDGYRAIEILRSFYGEDLYINTAQSISGIPASWPGYNLEKGSTGEKVRLLQEEINGIHKGYPAIPEVAVDGIYGPATQAAVKKIQSVFGLPATGIVDYPTWYKISEVYVGVSRIAELD